jgi:hypothetical protein
VTGDASIRQFLDRLRLLLFGAATAAGLLRLGALGAAVAVLDTLLGERSSAPPWLVFAAALAGTVVFWAAAARVAFACRVPGREAAARRVQRLAPEFRNDLESSLELGPLAERPGPGEFSRPLVGALVAGTGERVGAAAARRFVDWRAVGAALALLLATAAPLLALLLTPPGVPASALRAVVDPRVYWPLGQIALATEPGDALVVRGEPLTVRARVSGGRPARVLLRFEGGGGGEGIAEMSRGADGAYAWRFTAVMSDFRYRALAGDASSPWHQVRVVDRPAAGNFACTYTYPAYTGLGTRRTAGSGDLEALRGTTAEVTFAVNKELVRAVAVLGGTRAEARATGPRSYSVPLYLAGEESYRLELEDAAGFRNGGGATFAIRYLPDAPPTVELLEPAGTVETELRAPLLVRYRAADDFGLSRLALVARLAAGERRQPLPLGTAARSAAGEYAWDLAALGPAPGEVIQAYVEAVDNDTISGPKVSASAPLTIRVADPRQRSEELEETMKKLSDELVQLLGEELDLQGRYEQAALDAAERWGEFDWAKMAEATARQQAARDAADRAGERVDALAAQLERSPEGRDETLFQADLLKRGLQELRERQLEPMRDLAEGLQPAEAPRDEVQEKAGYLQRYADDAVAAAEQLVLMAEAMRQGTRMADVDRGTDRMAGAEDRLLESLDRLAPGDRAGAAEVMKQLEEIGRALEELAEALSRENKELPEEFLNSDALKDLDLGAMMDEVEQIKELLRKGDVAGAKKAARALAEKLADLRNRLDRAGGEFEEKFARALERLQGGTIPELDKLAAEQRSLLGRTEALEKNAGPRLEEALRRMVRDQNTAAPPAEADLLTPEERTQSEAFAREQEGIRVRAAKLVAEVAALKAVLPFLPPEVGKNIERAVADMAEARELLARREPGQALPPERAALAELSKASAEASRSLDEMGQMQGMRRGGQGLPTGKMGGSMPGAPSSDGKSGRRPGGRRGTDVRNFLIPGKQDFRAPRLFREEILKSLREGYPAQYEERIKDYYQRITE